MIAVLGTLGVAIGLVSALGGAATLVAARVLGQPERCRQALAWIAAMTAGCVLAVAAMEIALLSDNFSIAYVARNSTIATPLIYKIATLWGALEGSILLWILVLCGYVAAAAWRFRGAHRGADGGVGAGRDAGRVHLLLCAARWPRESFRHSRRSAARRRRLEPAAAQSPAHGHPSGDAVSRLRRIHCAVRIRGSCAHHGAVRHPVAGRHPPLDAGGLGLSGHRDHARRMVVIRGAGLGRLLGVGSRGERLAAAVADRHRVRALAHHPAAPPDAAGVEPLAAHRDVCLDDLRHVSHALGRARIGARIQRVVAGTDPAGLLRRHRRDRRSASGVAGRSPAHLGQPGFGLVARGRVLGQQPAVCGRGIRGAARHGVPALGGSGLE